MWALYKKEIRGFLTSVTGWVVLGIFLVVTGLFLWVLPSGMNIPEGGYANVNGLFQLAPFVFLFLIPAVTMHSFSDEISSGTMELLLTKPLSDTRIILSKYFAQFTLVLLALLPTLIYYFSVYQLAYPVGNVDSGGYWGSYIGLIFLAASFAAVGVFSSSLSGNQIISFLLAVVISAFLYLGFSFIGPFFGNNEYTIELLGISAHYQSISRGVIDTRDVLYFLSILTLFLYLTKFVLSRRKWSSKASAPGKKIKRQNQLQLLFFLVLLLVANWLASVFYTRIDLTSDKRFTLSSATRHLLEKMNHPAQFTVYLKGNFPAGFQRLERETKEMLEEFRAYNHRIRFTFVNPSASSNPKTRERMYQQLVSQGLNPTNLQVKTKSGLQQQLIFPGALVSYNGKSLPLSLLENQINVPPEEVLNHSVENLEYLFAEALYRLMQKQKPSVGWVQGQGELKGKEVADIRQTLGQEYHFTDTPLTNHSESTLLKKEKDSIVPAYQVLIVAKPTKKFTEQEKFALDQYLMYGGKILWFVDPVLASMDSIRSSRSEETVAIDRGLGIQELLFRYGIRLNKDLIMDLNATTIPVKTGEMGSQAQIKMLPWYYFPLVTPQSNNPIVRNLNSIQMQFVSSIDTLAVKGIRKTILLKSSPYTGIEDIPGIVSLAILRENPNTQFFRGPGKAVAVLLEGHFPSDYTNRVVSDILQPGIPFRNRSKPTTMIVVSDGDVLRNQLQIPGKTPLPLGYDQFNGTTYGNKQLVLNALSYLTEGPELLSLRSRELKLRMLDKTKVNNQLLKWQLINLLVPLLYLVVLTLIFVWIRKRKFGR
ncbi:MAG: gliding motility-associated ABC transporter substrate-binding protein GldG [Bacteroidales bacterium]|nr:gliding motility-associated ABC transporter substrate-binding protein GldG [Bacteroidales bacterium]